MIKQSTNQITKAHKTTTLTDVPHFVNTLFTLTRVILSGECRDEKLSTEHTDDYFYNGKQFKLDNNVFGTMTFPSRRRRRREKMILHAIQIIVYS